MDPKENTPRAAPSTRTPDSGEEIRQSAASPHGERDFQPRTGPDIRDQPVPATPREREGSVPNDDTDWEKRVARGDEAEEEGRPHRDVNDDVLGLDTPL